MHIRWMYHIIIVICIMIYILCITHKKESQTLKNVFIPFFYILTEFFNVEQPWKMFAQKYFSNKERERERDGRPFPYWWIELKPPLLGAETFPRRCRKPFCPVLIFINLILNFPVDSEDLFGWKVCTHTHSGAPMTVKIGEGRILYGPPSLQHFFWFLF